VEEKLKKKKDINIKVEDKMKDLKIDDIIDIDFKKKSNNNIDLKNENENNHLKNGEK